MSEASCWWCPVCAGLRVGRRWIAIDMWKGCIEWQQGLRKTRPSVGGRDEEKGFAIVVVVAVAVSAIVAVLVQDESITVGVL